MEQLKHYKIDKDTSVLKVVGSAYVDQITETTIKLNRELYSTYQSLPSKYMPEELPDFNVFVFDKRAKITDVVSNLFVGIKNGIFVNEKIHNILKRYKIKNYKVFPLKILSCDRKSEYDYFFYYIYESQEIVNYPKSKFATTNIIRMKEYEALLINSCEEYHSKETELMAESKYIKPKKVILDEFFDLARLPFSIGLIISERLKKRLENEGVTGVSIESSVVYSEDPIIIEEAKASFTYNSEITNKESAQRLKKSQTKLNLNLLWEPISEEELYLKKLKRLTLSYNYTGELPKFINRLSTLEYFEFCSNRMLSGLPDEFRNLKNLKELRLEGNSFTTIPHCVCELKNLEKLVLESNSITELPEDIGKLKKLRYLDLTRNPIKKLPESIGELESLEYLGLTYTLVENLPKSIGKLKNLSSLICMNANLKSLPEEIGGLERIKSLYLRDNTELDSLPESLSALTELEDIDIGGCNFDVISREVCNIPNLKFLRVGKNKIKELPEYICDLKNLKSLFVQSNHTCEIPRFLSKLPLMYIDMAYNPVTGFPENFDEFETLQEIGIAFTPLAELRVPKSLKRPVGIKIRKSY